MWIIVTSVVVILLATAGISYTDSSLTAQRNPLISRERHLLLWYSTFAQYFILLVITKPERFFTFIVVSLMFLAVQLLASQLGKKFPQV
ncbi:hypothetical protein [Arcanobacterium phocae]|uniref:hypothetical protein n=1 Tax=Arcanobacterium phocae TaxID=131112 RepID=UPI001C0EC88A|nr:hypothetical protein [Arcanobacterium phocae]